MADATGKKSELTLKPAPEYITIDPNAKPGPKNGHYSELDPLFASYKDATDAAIAQVWASPDWTTFRQAWRLPGPLPEGCPQEGKDVVSTYEHVTVRDGAKVEIKIMKSPNVQKDATLILRTHGGGWAVGWHGTEEGENLTAAAHPEVVLVSVDYRMAPEYPFPYPVNDAFDVLLWCKENASKLGVNPERIILLGGSAGAGLSAVIAQKARDEGVTGIIAQILDYPVTCHPSFFPKDKYELNSYVQNHDATIVDAVKMEFFWDLYQKPAQPDPYHSPLLAKSLKGLPPAFIQVAGADPLRDEAIAYAEALKEAGVPVELHIYKGLPHFFSNGFPNIPQGIEYMKRQDEYMMKAISESKSFLSR